MCFTVRAWFFEKKTNTFSGSAVFVCPDIGTQRRTTSALLRRLMQFLANQRTLTGLLRGHWNWLRALFTNRTYLFWIEQSPKWASGRKRMFFWRSTVTSSWNPCFLNHFLLHCYSMGEIAIGGATKKISPRLQHSDAVVGPSPGSSWALHLQICGGIPGIMLCLVVVIYPSEKD